MRGADSSPDLETRPTPLRQSRRRYSLRTLLLAMLLLSLLTLWTLWWSGIGLGNGKALAAVFVVILGTASIGGLVRGRLQMSLRLWLIAFTLLAAFMARYGQDFVAAAKQRKAVGRIMRLDGSADYGDFRQPKTWFTTRRGLPLPGWLRDFFGPDLFCDVVSYRFPQNCGCSDDDLAVLCRGAPYIGQLSLASCPKVTDAGLRHVAELKELTYIDLDGAQASELGVRHLSRLPKLTAISLYSNVTDETLSHLTELQLKQLWLMNAGITDQGMKQVVEMPQLETVCLNGAGIGDASVKYFSQLEKLRTLYLERTGISDASVPELSKLSGLRALNVVGTSMTAAGVAELRNALPGCVVHY